MKELKSSVNKTFALLEYFTVQRPEWSITDLALEIGSNKSTVYRFLSDMEKRGILYQNQDTGKYGLGLKLFELGNRVQITSAFTDRTHPILLKVAQEITETVHIAVLRNHQVYYIDKVESPQGLRINTTIGTSNPLHATSLGKVLLAYQPEAYQMTIKGTTLQPFTENTLTDPKKLKEALEEIKAQGFAVDYEEFEIGLICVAVPIFNQQKEIVASLSAAGPANRFKVDELKNYVKTLQKGADEIQKNIGDFKMNMQ